MHNVDTTVTLTQAFITLVLCKLHAAHQHLMLVQFLLLFPGKSSGIVGLLCRVLAQLLFQSLHISGTPLECGADPVDPELFTMTSLGTSHMNTLHA